MKKIKNRKHIFFRDEEIVIHNVRVFRDARIGGTIKENLKGRIKSVKEKTISVLKELAESQSMVELKEALEF